MRLSVFTARYGLMIKNEHKYAHQTKLCISVNMCYRQRRWLTTADRPYYRHRRHPDADRRTVVLKTKDCDVVIISRRARHQDWLTNWLTNWLTDWLTNWLTSCVTEWLLTNQLTGWLPVLTWFWLNLQRFKQAMVHISDEQRFSLLKVTVESHPVQLLSAHILNWV